MGFTKKRKFLSVDESVTIIKLFQSGRTLLSSLVSVAQNSSRLHYFGREQDKIRGWGGAL